MTLHGSSCSRDGCEFCNGEACLETRLKTAGWAGGERMREREGDAASLHPLGLVGRKWSRASCREPVMDGVEGSLCPCGSSVHVELVWKSQSANHRAECGL